ncbi:MAG: mercury(II) reductase [Hyphomicrobiales bacterium]|nr:mercury(II) reductase [Hyphomicrobiales bacterium]
MSNCCESGPTGTDPYDLAVIGAGSAGFSAAITAAGEGARVALIGHGTIGGTCVNVGCVPSKTMIRAAEALHGARVASRFPGMAGEAHVTDWHRLIAAKDDLVSTMRQKKYVDLLPAYDGISYVEGSAKLNGQGVMVNDAAVGVDKVIIATGSSAALPDIPGISDIPYLTSTTALELTELPRSLIIIGGGYVGCELAQMFARLGTNVTLATRSRLVPEAEPEISNALAGYFRDEEITVRTGLTYERIDRTAAGVVLTVEVDVGRADRIAGEKVLIATGRSPNTANLGLGEAGIDLTPNGGVSVDDRMRTSRSGVYGAGDVTGEDQFVYMAAYGAKLAALNALNGDSLVYDNAAMPWVVFTDPQIAGVGMSEAAATSAGFETKVSLVPLDQVPRALAARDTRGLIKLVADARSDRLLGAQIMAPEGGDSIQTMVLALQHGMTAKALGETVFPYLTTVEGLKLAAQSFGKNVTKLSCCAG